MIIIYILAIIGLATVVYYCWQFYIQKKDNSKDLELDRVVADILSKKKHEELEKLWNSGPEGKEEYNRIRSKEWEDERSARERKWALFFKQLSNEDKEFLSYLYLLIHCCDVGCETVLVIFFKDMANKEATINRMFSINKKYKEEFFYACTADEESLQFQMDPELYDEIRNYARANKYEIMQ